MQREPNSDARARRLATRDEEQNEKCIKHISMQLALAAIKDGMTETAAQRDSFAVALTLMPHPYHGM